jgi:hypothetical protein
MQKKNYITFFLCCLFLSVLAQQTLSTSFYRYNWQILNPAAIDNEFIKNIGITGAANGRSMTMFSSGYRQNIISPDNHQFAFYASGEQRLLRRKTYHKKNLNARIGGILAVNNTEFLRNYTLSVNFAYQLTFEPRHTLHLGINAGGDFANFQAVTKARFKNPDEVNFQNVQQLRPSFAAGLFYTKEGLHLGVSFPQLSNKSLLFSALTANYELTHLEPSVTLRYLPSLSVFAWSQKFPFSADFNLRYHIRSKVGRGVNIGRDKTYFGVGYGTANVLNFEFGRFIPSELMRNTSVRFGASAGVSLLGKYGIGNFFELNSAIML